MGLIHAFSVGGLRCVALEAGLQRLDGGAMFGVVPRPLWSRRITPDAENRIPLAMRCLLVDHPAGLVLIDTGLGNKEDSKFHRIYGIENEGPGGRTRLEAALHEAGCDTGQVRWVVNTHLHFDHAGGNTFVPRAVDGTAAGPPEVGFPNATYVVQAGELAFARAANERTRASYLVPSYEPVAAAGRFRLLEGAEEILPGIRAWPTPGHVPHHQSILIEDRGEHLVYLADVMPTTHHLPLPWIMGYDLEPLRTLESKRTLLRDAVDAGWTLFFEHDAEVIMGRVSLDARGVPALVDVVRRTESPPA